MSPDQPAAHDPLVRLPAERRQLKNEGITLYAGCCCCCCCCLHTIGGVIGAACAGSFRAKPTREVEDDEDEFDYVPTDPADRSRLLVSSQRLFWISLLVVILLQVVVAGIVKSRDRDLTELLLDSGAGLLMLGPLYLFAACVVMAIWIGLSPSLRRHPGYFQSALRIFGTTFLGAAVGMGAMIGIVVLISLGKG